jgi:DNA-binding response OmpR family regulator
MARVLVVEDEPNIGGIIVFKLEREGHEVRWETEAEAGSLAAQNWPHHLVLLDSSLPDADSLFILDRMKLYSPVVMLTEFRDEHTPKEAVARGAMATISKPFKPTQLARLVAQLIPAGSA